MNALAVAGRALLLFCALLGANGAFADKEEGVAAGGMFVAPAKLTLSAGAVAELYVVNQSRRVRDFRVVVSPLTERDADFVDGGERLRFGPRQFSLPPDQTMAVRFTAKSADDGIDAPQRARIKVRILPEVKPQDDANPLTSGQLGFRFLGIYAISVPIDIIP